MTRPTWEDESGPLEPLDDESARAFIIGICLLVLAFIGGASLTAWGMA